MKFFYHLGHSFQFLALVAMPFAIWEGELRHNERSAILIFAGSLAIFFVGWAIVRALR